MTAKISAFIDSARTRARAIKSRHDELGSSVSLAQAYELLAAAEGYRTWAAMRAAGEAGTDTSTIDVHEDENGWLFSVLLYRQIGTDAYDAVEGFDVPALLRAAYADLAYVFMDGEEHPAIRFRDTVRTGDDEYSVIADIVGSPRRDLDWHLGRLKHADNVIRFSYASYPGDEARSDAAFPGSDRHSYSQRWAPSRTSGSHR